jgi:hypothetical protein
MKLSIFPKSKALPVKEEKGKEARFTSKPYYPEIREFTTHEDLIEIICNNAWSPSLFEEFRRQDGFISTDLIVLDIDDGMTVEEAEDVVHKLDIAALCIPSTSFSEELHKFRLVFPLAKTITRADVFSATMAKLAEYFPADPACLGDVARFFFGGKLVQGFWFESKLLEPVKPPEKVRKVSKMDFSTHESVVVGESLEELVEALYGESRTKIPESIAYYLTHAPENLSGEWYCRSNSFLFTCGLLDLDRDVVSEVFFSLYPHYELTPEAVYRMIDDGARSRDD